MNYFESITKNLAEHMRIFYHDNQHVNACILKCMEYIGEENYNAVFESCKHNDIDTWLYEVHKTYRQMDVSDLGIIDSIFWNLLNSKAESWYEIAKEMIKGSVKNV